MNYLVIRKQYIYIYLFLLTDCNIYMGYVMFVSHVKHKLGGKNNQKSGFSSTWKFPSAHDVR